MATTTVDIDRPDTSNPADVALVAILATAVFGHEQRPSKGAMISALAFAGYRTNDIFAALDARGIVA